MNKIKFDYLMLILSFGFSMVCAFCCLKICYGKIENEEGQILWNAAYFTIPLLGTLIGVCITEIVRRRKFIIRKKGSRILSFFLAAVCSFILGAVGQILYMYIGEHKENVSQTNTNVVFLIDSSASMEKCKQSAIDAACTLIDKMSNKNYVQIISFAGSILENTGFKQMNTAGKTEIKNLIQGIHTNGKTNFNEPLKQAYYTLSRFTGEDRRRAVILLTDDDSQYIPLEDGIENKFIKEKIPIYSISILRNGSGNLKRNLMEIVKQSGGFDTAVEKNAAGGIKTEELLKALEYTYQSLESQTVISKELLSFGNENITILRFLLRVFVFILYGILTTWIVYYSFSQRWIVINGVLGLVTAVLVTIAGKSLISIGVFGLVYWTAFTRYYTVRKTLKDTIENLHRY